MEALHNNADLLSFRQDVRRKEFHVCVVRRRGTPHEILQGEEG